MRSSLRILGALSVAGVVASGCSNPEVAAKEWDEIQTVEQNMTELRSYNAELETSLDSLRKIVARQDSALRIIVDFTGAQVPAYRGGP